MNIPKVLSKDWIEKFYEKEDPWGIRQHKRLQQRACRTLNLLGANIYNLCIDLCCGEGTITTKYLAKHCKNVIGIDFSTKAIERATELTIKNPSVKFINADILNFDFDEIKPIPDLIVCSDAFHYFDRSQQKEILKKIVRLKSTLKFLLIVRLLFKPFCSEHPDLVAYTPNYDFFDNWDELKEISRDSFVIKKVVPVMDHIPENIPWGDNVISVSIRKIFYFLLVRGASRCFSRDIEKIDEKRFKLIKIYYQLPVLNWFAKRFIFYYAILLECR